MCRARGRYLVCYAKIAEFELSSPRYSGKNPGTHGFGSARHISPHRQNVKHPVGLSAMISTKWVLESNLVEETI
jgi:gamma-glutamyl phosphate reductase